MVGFRSLLAGTAMLALATPLLAQRSTGTIAGQVIDRQTQRPLVGAQVRVAGTDRGALTGEGGAYRITGVQAGSVTVAAQRIGYAAVSRTVTVTPDGTTTADFGLTVSVTTLDQVIVTATGQSERKRESGVNTATIDGSQIVKAAVSTFADVLSSRSPGVVVQQAAGESGAGARIRIRGSNSISLSNDPLIIVDGIRVDNSANSTAIGTGGQQPSRYNDINPENIASIEIIKGPAASSLYGTAASNGVIQITTKKGRVGRTKWETYAEYGKLRDVNDYPVNYRSFGKTPAGALVTNCSLIARVSTAATRCVGVDSTITNFPLEVANMIDDGNRRIAGLSASGGSDVATYFLSGEYQKEQNVIALNGLQRLNIRTNLRGQLARNLDANVSIGYTNSDLRRPQNDNNAFGVVSGSLLGKAADCGPGGLAARYPGLCGARYAEPRLLQRQSRSEGVLQHQHAPEGAAVDRRGDEQLDPTLLAELQRHLRSRHRPPLGHRDPAPGRARVQPEHARREPRCVSRSGLQLHIQSERAGGVVTDTGRQAHDDARHTVHGRLPGAHRCLRCEAARRDGLAGRDERALLDQRADVGRPHARLPRPRAARVARQGVPHRRRTHRSEQRLRDELSPDLLSLPQQLLGAQRGRVLPEGRRDLVAAAPRCLGFRGTESRAISPPSGRTPPSRSSRPAPTSPASPSVARAIRTSSRRRAPRWKEDSTSDCSTTASISSTRTTTRSPRMHSST